MLPSISGTVGGQTVAVGNSITPFASASIRDPNPYTSDTITVTLLNTAGVPTDANGELVLGNARADTSFAHTSTGTYTLANLAGNQPVTYVDGLNAVLSSLKFIPSGGGGQTTFAIHVIDTYNEPADDRATTVTVGSTGGVPNNQTLSTPSTPSTPTSPEDTGATSFTVANNGNEAVESGDSVHLLSGSVDLKGLLTAASTSWRNDILSIFGKDGAEVASVKVTGSNFTVEQTSTGVTIFTGDDTHHADGTWLPYH